jgi:N-acetylmuramoyl-L-alanine amidase
MKLIDYPSPNHGPRAQKFRVDTVLIHHTGGAPGDNSVAWLCNPKSEASAHYVVDVDGKVFRLVDEKRAAWHAGWGRLPWEPGTGYNFNHRSIGIEVVNPGDGKTPFTEAQYVALAALMPDVVRRIGRDIFLRLEPRLVEGPQTKAEPAYVLGHRDIACFRDGRFGRKADPADNFDWGRVRAALSAGGGA